MPLARGSRVGRYEILDRLGAGGMGEVYTARDHVLDRTVALKLLPDEFASDPDRVRRFELEARATGRLNHPHIVGIFDAVLDTPQPFLVTEMVEGETLGTRLAAGPLPVENAIILARQVAGALAAAHAQGIVHRDLKPDNILITHDGVAKVLDFGLAKVVAAPLAQDETQMPATMPGVTLGTVGYMAPEQVEGGQVDHRSDLFSLGVVLHEALTGRAPFRRPSVVDTLHAILHDEPPALPEHVPRSLRQIVSRCLQKRADARFQSARDLEFALSTAAADPSTATTSHSAGWPLRAALAAATLVVLGAGWMWLHSRASDAAAPSIRSILVLPLEDLSKQPDQEYLADSLTEALITDLSQVRALRVISRASAMRYKGSREPLQDISRELGVTGIVEGTVQRVGDRVRVSAHLVQAPSEQLVWGDQYDREFRDVLALQSELASTIAERIAVQLTPQERARLNPAATETQATAELYLRGRYFWNKRDPASLQLALDAFTAATKADPASARSWAGLADTYFYLGYAFGRMAPIEAMPKVRDAARRALSIDPDLAEAHTSLGLVALFFDWDRATAISEFRRSIQLNPAYVLAHRAMAAALLTGRDWQGAAAESREAVRLDPVSLAENYFLSLCYLAGGDLDAAERSARRTLELEPGFSRATNVLGDVAARRGEDQKAFELYLDAARKEGAAPAQISRLSNAFKTGGLKAFREAQLQDMVKSWDGWHFGAFVIAINQAATGHREAALDWLARVRDAKSAGIMLANSEDSFSSLRSDPRFRQILGRAYSDH
jgi:serine/threonine protein kinase/tetratricopeptide (TPR) repeat protein